MSSRALRGPFTETRFQLALRGVLRSTSFDAFRFLDALGRLSHEAARDQAVRWTGFVTLRQVEACFQEAGALSCGNFVDNIPEYIGNEHWFEVEGGVYVAAVVVFTNVAGMQFSWDTVGKDRVLSLCCFISGREQTSPFPLDAKVASRERHFFEGLVQGSVQREGLFQVFLSAARVGLCTAASPTVSCFCACSPACVYVPNCTLPRAPSFPSFLMQLCKSISFSPSSFPGILLSAKVFDEEAVSVAIHGLQSGSGSSSGGAGGGGQDGGLGGDQGGGHGGGRGDDGGTNGGAETSVVGEKNDVDGRDGQDGAESKERGARESGASLDQEALVAKDDDKGETKREALLKWQTSPSSPGPLQRQNSEPVTQKEKEVGSGDLMSRVSSWISSAVGSGDLERKEDRSKASNEGSRDKGGNKKMDKMPSLKSPSPRKLKRGMSGPSSKRKDGNMGSAGTGEGEPTTPQSFFGQAMNYLPEQLRQEKGLAEKFEQGTQWLEENALARFGRDRVEEAGGLQNFLFDRVSNISRSAIGGVALLFMANVLFLATVIIFDFAMGYYVMDLFTSLAVPREWTVLSCRFFLLFFLSLLSLLLFSLSLSLFLSLSLPLPLSLSLSLSTSILCLPPSSRTADAKTVAFATVGGANLVVTFLVYLCGRASIANSTAGLYFDGEDEHDDVFDEEYDDEHYDVYGLEFGAMEDGRVGRRRLSVDGTVSDSKRSKK